MIFSQSLCGEVADSQIRSDPSRPQARATGSLIVSQFFYPNGRLVGVMPDRIY